MDHVWTAGRSWHGDNVWVVSYSNGTVVLLPMVYTNWNFSTASQGFVIMLSYANWEWRMINDAQYYFLCEIP